ncbi:MAG: hypothetical protein WBE70_09470, partial [Candidatus Acidiferrum sp.]
LPANPPAMSTLPFGRSVELWLARAMCMAATSDTEPGTDGHGVSPREKNNTGKSISESRR